MYILNLGAGKLKPLSLPKDSNFIINLDQSYFTGLLPEDAENYMRGYKKRGATNNVTIHCKTDAFEFMERTTLKFDRIVMYRFLEHIPFDRVLYFIYLVSTISKLGAIVDIIVPDYKILAKMLLAEDDILYLSALESHNIILTTELLNEPGCPHASIWTPQRIDKFWELENRFKVLKTESPFKFDSRNIYLRSIVERK